MLDKILDFLLTWTLWFMDYLPFTADDVKEAETKKAKGIIAAIAVVNNAAMFVGLVSFHVFMIGVTGGLWIFWIGYRMLRKNKKHSDKTK